MRNGLTRAGREQWIVLTKDKLIRRQPLERDTLLAAKVRAFVFTGGNMSGIEMTASIVNAIPRMLRVIENTLPPFIARITGSGAVDLIVPADDDR